MELKSRDHSGFFEKTELFLSGKRFAALGARESGKTTFLELVTKGILRTQYTATGESVPIPAKRVQLGNSILNVRGSSDVSGAPLAYGDWKLQHFRADYVIYFVNIIHLDKNNDNINQICSDMKVIAWCRGQYRRWEIWPTSVVAVTHCDKLVGYPGYGASSGWAEFADGVRNRPLLRQLALVLDGAPQKQIAVGSLGSMEAAIKFLSDIFKKLGLVQ